MAIKRGSRLIRGDEEGDGSTEEDEMFQRALERIDDFNNIPIMLLERCYDSLEFLF